MSFSARVRFPTLSHKTRQGWGNQFPFLAHEGDLLSKANRGGDFFLTFGVSVLT